ncbi:MAG TPA: DUF2203 domain-containing protein [Verrucomicrobiae bacterium]|nr:DUF2203 domain-containing protein [Verrucomicrobiae bacterium]
MIYRFEKHYTRDEARALLPQVRRWLKRVTDLRAQFGKQDSRVASLLAAGSDVGGEPANNWVKLLWEIKTVLKEFKSREIQIKDVDRGLIDFPAIIGGREVFLCWEQDEDDIEYWHELDTGYAGRERL